EGDQEQYHPGDRQDKGQVSDDFHFHAMPLLSSDCPTRHYIIPEMACQPKNKGPRVQIRKFCENRPLYDGAGNEYTEFSNHSPRGGKEVGL
ncbi:hypothetical protein, partial [uncultured Flavonifractor sp.]|uniref:hypothetical protein n=1 Tax=uncultured Flavonifractor sp. TaxID=1193534 RepID=UPI0026703737